VFLVGQRMGREKCCNMFCLSGMDMQNATDIMLACLDELKCFTKKEKKAYIYSKVLQTCWTGKHSTKGYYKYEWKIGVGKNSKRNVCRDAFMIAYDIKPTYLIEICHNIKRDNINTDSVFNDKENYVTQDKSNQTYNQLIKYSKSKGITLTVHQLAAMQIPNTHVALDTYGWMDAYFQLIGDIMPNSHGDIHLEPITIKEVHCEYLLDCKLNGVEFYNYNDFAKLWTTCFPYVKIREFKAVSGKCNTCAILSDLRRKCNDKQRKQEITYLHCLHRSAYMNERLEYCKRRTLAIQFPKLYLSLISDGMAQSHCQLPHLGNMTTFNAHLKQHIQGLIAHGRGLYMHRTYHTVDNCANLQIHTLLMSLEDISKKEGSLPSTFFYQIDGGSENTAKVVIALMEFLISKRFFQTIVLTRLMVGHTHEDIDGKYGRLWRYIRCRHVQSPDDYKQAISDALTKTNGEFVEQSEIIVIPDYAAYFEDCLDPKFGDYAKGAKTQLQFIFNVVEVSSSFPLGCCTTYRAFSSSDVIELVEDETAITGVSARSTKVSTYPQQTFVDEKNTQQTVEGMYILQRYPPIDRVLKPVGFPSESLSLFSNVMGKVKKFWEKSSPSTVNSWTNWADEIKIPKTESVEEHIADHPNAFYVPFLEKLFSPSSTLESNQSSVASLNRLSYDSLLNSLPRFVTEPVVTWQNRNKISKKFKSARRNTTELLNSTETAVIKDSIRTIKINKNNKNKITNKTKTKKQSKRKSEENLFFEDDELEDDNDVLSSDDNKSEEYNVSDFEKNEVINTNYKFIFV